MNSETEDMHTSSVQQPGETPAERREEHTVYELFKWSILLKGAISVAEVLAGIILLFIPARHVINAVQAFGAWLAVHADSAIAGHVVGELSAFGEGSALFVSIYLLTRGLIKCGLIAALLRNVLWAYPASLAVLGVFIVYQAYEILTKGSVFVIAITAFDAIVVYLIWREWNIVTRHGGMRPL